MKICSLTDPIKKASVCESIIRNLPKWFSLESGILEYIESSKEKGSKMLAVLDKDKYIAFLITKEIKPNVTEIIVMGVLENYQRKGLGTKLLNHVIKENQKNIIVVKTLDKCAGDENDYALTRSFYKKSGFIELMTLNTVWDESNPCLIMIKSN